MKSTVDRFVRVLNLGYRFGHEPKTQKKCFGSKTPANAKVDAVRLNGVAVGKALCLYALGSAAVDQGETDSVLSN